MSRLPAILLTLALQTALLAAPVAAPRPVGLIIDTRDVPNPVPFTRFVDVMVETLANSRQWEPTVLTESSPLVRVSGAPWPDGKAGWEAAADTLRALLIATRLSDVLVVTPVPAAANTVAVIWLQADQPGLKRLQIMAAGGGDAGYAGLTRQLMARLELGFAAVAEAPVARPAAPVTPPPAAPTAPSTVVAAAGTPATAAVARANDPTTAPKTQPAGGTPAQVELAQPATATAQPTPAPSKAETPATPTAQPAAAPVKTEAPATVPAPAAPQPGPAAPVAVAAVTPPPGPLALPATPVTAPTAPLTAPVTPPTAVPTAPVTQPVTPPTAVPTAQVTQPATPPTAVPTAPVTQPVTPPTTVPTAPVTQPVAQVAPPPTQPQEPSQFLTAADKYLREGDFLRVEDMLLKAEDAHDSKAAVLYGWARLEEARQNRAAERTWLERTLAEDPGNLPARLRLAELLRGSGLWRKAVEEYNLVLKAQPDNVFAYLGLSAVWAGQSQPRRAAEILTEALQHRPADASLYLRLGDLQAQRNALAEAEDAYDRAARLSQGEKRADALDRLGDLYVGAAREREGFICYAEASKLRSESNSPLAEKRYQQIMAAADEALGKVIGSAAQGLDGYRAGRSVTREEAFNAMSDFNTQVQEVSKFVESITPPTSLKLAHAERQLAYSLASEAALYGLLYLDQGKQVELGLYQARLTESVRSLQGLRRPKG